MAKIFKVSGYFVDANGVVDKEKFEGKLESLEDLFSHHLHVERRKPFELRQLRPCRL